MVLEQKYRPRKLSELIGQQSVVTTISNSIELGKMHHAYLFHGQFGGGKTSCAKILAAMVNCEKGPTVDPCGKCIQCTAIFQGKHNDVLEFDAASGGKIDQVRELRKTAFYSPVAGAKKKVYIIDECHSLTSEAEESLLRIIEEPPPHVIFVLCTTEFNKMRSTIVSRCQSHAFTKIYWTQIVQHLQGICDKEKVSIDESAIKACAIMANGSVRDSLKYLGTLISFAGDKTITGEMARQALGFAGSEIYHKLMTCIIGQDGKPKPVEGYKLINQLLTSGGEFRVFIRGLDEHLRCLLIMLTAPQAAEMLTLDEDDKKRIQMEATKFAIPHLDLMMTQLNEVHRCLNYGIPEERLLDQWFMKSVCICHLSQKEK